MQSWRTEDTHFITDRILENLRFKKSQNTYETARHTLFQLLQQENPKDSGQKLLFLLLDGLNEVCNVSKNEQLLSEIRIYAAMSCVSVLAASRSLESGLGSWPVITLNPLSENCVKEILTKEQLLIPEEKEVINILRIPLMLSLFLNSSKTKEQQIFIHTQAELLETYLGSLASKFPDIPKARTEMAVYLILPAIAHEFQKRKCPLSDKVLMGITNQAFRLLSSRFLMKAFPQWTGHSGEIKGEAATPDIWYGMIIHDLLWKRQGLLIRDGDTGYMVSHQILSSYLNTLYLPVQRKIWQRKRMQWTGILSSIMAAVLITIYCLSPPLYNEIYARNVIDYAVVAYGTAGEQYSGLRHLTDCAISSDSQAFNKNLRLYRNRAVNQKISGFNTTMAQAAVKQMLSTGKAMPGSKKPFDAEHYIELINFVEGRIEEYNELVETLVFVMDNENAYKNYSEIYFDLLSELIDTDAKITACLYQIVCEPHIKKLYGDNSAEADSLRIYIAAITEQNKFLSENMDLRILQRQLVILQGQRTDIIQEIHQCGAVAASKFAKEDSL